MRIARVGFPCIAIAKEVIAASDEGLKAAKKCASQKIFEARRLFPAPNLRPFFSKPNSIGRAVKR